MGVNNTNCCVFGCKSKKGKTPHISFHRFPKKNETSVYITNKFGVKEKVDKYEAWMMILKIERPVSQYMKVCSEHFNRDDFFLPNFPTKKPRLKLYAVPSQNLPQSSIISKTIPPRRERKVVNIDHTVMMPALEYANEESIVTPNSHGFVHNCTKCPYVTKSSFSISNHVKRHRIKCEFLFDCSRSTPEFFLCKECSFQTYKTTDFNNHIRDHNLQIPTRYVKTNTKWLYCDKCSFKSKWITTVKRHKTAKHPTSVDTKWFECDQCPYNAKLKSALKRHIYYKHTAPGDIKWFHCEKCSFKSKQKSGLKSHMLAKHTSSENIKWFHCEMCSYKTKTGSHLKSHTRVRHTSPNDIKWVQCDQCFYMLKNKRNLRKHLIRNHGTLGDAEGFQCDKCSFKAKYKHQLKNHRYLKHDSSDDEKWFQCDQCFYKARYKSNLRRHVLLKHTPLENVTGTHCDKCSFTTKYKHLLKIHKYYKHPVPNGAKCKTKQTLLTDKWFHCDICSYKSKRRDELMQHMITRRHSPRSFEQSIYLEHNYSQMMFLCSTTKAKGKTD